MQTSWGLTREPPSPLLPDNFGHICQLTEETLKYLLCRNSRGTLKVGIFAFNPCLFGFILP